MRAAQAAKHDRRETKAEAAKRINMEKRARKLRAEDRRFAQSRRAKPSGIRHATGSIPLDFPLFWRELTSQCRLCYPPASVW